MRIVACELATLQHWPVLQAAHCQAVEGTAVSPPLAVHAILQWVRQWEASQQRR
jgi:EAL domain-containing protein (putative c-di-GMP-specific phosphodiesterase class I)